MYILVEENCANRKTFGTKYGNRNGADWPGRTEERTKFRDTGQPHTGMISRLVCKRALQLARLGTGKRRFKKVRAFLLNRHFFD